MVHKRLVYLEPTMSVVHDRPPRHGLDVVWKDQVGITTADATTKNVVTTEPTDTTATTTEG